jgi:hypothetical protein
VRLIYGGNGDLLRSARGIFLRVPASSTIHATPRSVTGSRVVRFSGRVRSAGQPLPPRGLVVILQGREGGRWRTFDTARTNAGGAWHAAYRFRGRPGRYPVRVLIRRQSGFPFELGASPAVAVHVR